MPAIPIPFHVCNTYCRDGIHAVPCIAEACKDMNELKEGMEENANDYGWTIVSFKLAECDTEEWAASHKLTTLNGLLDTGYLVLVIEIERPS